MCPLLVTAFSCFPLDSKNTHVLHKLILDTIINFFFLFSQVYLFLSVLWLHLSPNHDIIFACLLCLLFSTLKLYNWGPWNTLTFYGFRTLDGEAAVQEAASPCCRIYVFDLECDEQWEFDTLVGCWLLDAISSQDFCRHQTQLFSGWVSVHGSCRSSTVFAVKWMIQKEKIICQWLNCPLFHLFCKLCSCNKTSAHECIPDQSCCTIN